MLVMRKVGERSSTAGFDLAQCGERERERERAECVKRTHVTAFQAFLFVNDRSVTLFHLHLTRATGHGYGVAMHSRYRLSALPSLLNSHALSKPRLVRQINYWLDTS